MGFEISGITYDATRKLQKRKFKAVNTTDANKQYYQYNPVPYNISFNLYSFTATVRRWSTNYRTNFTLLST